MTLLFDHIQCKEFDVRVLDVWTLLLPHVFVSISIFGLIINNISPVMEPIVKLEPDIPPQIGMGSFSLFTPFSQEKNWLADLQIYAQELINKQIRIPLSNIQKQLQDYQSPFTKLIKDMIYTLLLKMFGGKQNEAFGIVNSLANLSFELYQALSVMCHLNLFIFSCKYDRQLTTSMVFQKTLFEHFIRCFFGKGQYSKFISFVDLELMFYNLASSDYKTKFINQLYCLCGGGFMTIEKKHLIENLTSIVTNMGRYFTQKSSFLTRHFKSIKKCKSVASIVNNSIKTICNYQNEDYVSMEISNIANSIFKQEKISVSDFVECVLELDKHCSNSMLWIYIDLLRVQCIISMDKGLAKTLKDMRIQSKESDMPNFYIQEMQKLLKKCPYNGDDCCNCGKCKCIRRNRKSAKLSQQKKRSAVEQLNPLKSRVKQLEERNQQLEEQNRILRGIVHQMKDLPGIQELLSSTLQPMNKMINDD